jgi:hypothetical protein
LKKFDFPNINPAFLPLSSSLRPGRRKVVDWERDNRHPGSSFEPLPKTNPILKVVEVDAISLFS